MMFKPHDTPELSPYFTVSNGPNAIKFYTEAFGFTLNHQADDPDGNFGHVSMKKGEVLIMFIPEGAYGSTKKTPAHLGIEAPLNFYVYCEDVDALYKQAIAHGAKSLMEPFDSFWGDRFCLVVDPDGYEWGFATHIPKL
jgi:uncharacterized glyoxalase superfamily protein PhnB